MFLVTNENMGLCLYILLQYMEGGHKRCLHKGDHIKKLIVICAGISACFSFYATISDGKRCSLMFMDAPCELKVVGHT